MDNSNLITKEIIKKIIIAIIFVFVFNFIFVNLGNNIVFATEKEKGDVLTDEEMEEDGGKFLLPIYELVLYIADAFLQLMQNTFISQQAVTVRAASKDMSEVDGWAIAGIVLGLAVAVGATVFTCGTATGVSLGIITKIRSMRRWTGSRYWDSCLSRG